MAGPAAASSIHAGESLAALKRVKPLFFSTCWGEEVWPWHCGKAWRMAGYGRSFAFCVTAFFLACTCLPATAKQCCDPDCKRESPCPRTGRPVPHSNLFPIKAHHSLVINYCCTMLHFLARCYFIWEDCGAVHHQGSWFPLLSVLCYCHSLHQAWAQW